MKTLVKTITVVSIATLTAVGTTKLNLNTYSGSEEKNSKTSIDIYYPQEESLLNKTQYLNEVTVHAYSSTRMNSLVEFKPDLTLDVDVTALATAERLSKQIRFAPMQPVVETEPIAAEEAYLAELIRFKPTEIEVSDLELNALIQFVPDEIDSNPITEPVSIDQLVKFTPSSLNNETIVEPISKLDELIKFTPCTALYESEIIEPQSINDMVKFQPLNWENELVEEPVTDCNSELVIK
ncbi:hypothetical protein C3K47_03740 [Solitalea longa]|uniref:Uncharacterized protein n=1 Tax=Solitalea longa TaxID=2079460 RepID=A0A2S5A8D5_9SPHI|nr:hypothetical protein [Solitalea longa]POY38517.1 hypothetical protein C3K47_03740 [Solitalea longa]